MSKTFNIKYLNEIFLLLIATYFMILLSVLFIGQNEIILPKVSLVSLLSLSLFVLIVFLSFYNKKWRFYFIPIIIIAFPSAVNNFFPYVTITAVHDKESIGFPIITHIDVYFLLHIFYAIKRDFRRANNIYNNKVHFLLIFLIISLVGGLIVSKDLWDIQLILVNSYQIRYIILISLFISFYNVFEYQKYLINGFAISLVFLLIESVIFSKLNNIDRLTSGSLGVNTFANIIASILVYFIWLKIEKRISLISFSVLLGIAVFIIFTSETRSALLVLPFSIVVFLIISNYKKTLKLVLLTLFLICLPMIVILTSKDFSSRYELIGLTKEFSSVRFSDVQRTVADVSLTKETSSILTRIELWSTSIQMINKNPIFGIGAGRWNKYKSEYGFDKNVLIDSHNDFLSSLSQFGILTGLLLWYTLFIYPIILFIRLKKLSTKGNNSILGLVFINISMLFAGFSNSGSYKHQVFALLAFNLICLCGYYNSVKMIVSEEDKNKILLKES